MLFRKLANQKEELETYKKIKKGYETLINKLIEKCKECKRTQYHRNPNIGFNEIQELIETDIKNIHKLEDELFLTIDE